MFKKATKSQGRLRLAFMGPPGSGKSWTSLIIACEIAKSMGKRVAAIDSERGSLSLYSKDFDFDVCELDSFAPASYVKAIHEAERGGYGVILIDSLSHAWAGKDGALEMVDNARAKDRSGNGFAAWRGVTPEHNALVDAQLQSKCHVISTLRSKVEYVQEKDDRTGKTVIRKVGLAPVQRDGLEYEFTLVGDIDTEHTMVITKTRCSALADKVIRKPGVEFARVLIDWLSDGEPVAEKVEPKPEFKAPVATVTAAKAAAPVASVAPATEDQIPDFPSGPLPATGPLPTATAADESPTAAIGRELAALLASARTYEDTIAVWQQIKPRVEAIGDADLTAAARSQCQEAAKERPRRAAEGAQASP